MESLKQHIVEVPNFPKEGILFYDIAPLLQNNFQETIDAMSNLFSAEIWGNIDVVAGIESRGFLFAAALAYKHNKGMTLIRKAGKLPNPGAKVSYGLEYGNDALEMQNGTKRVLLVDDVLATGGTFKAAADLCEKTGHTIIDMAALINLPTLNTFEWHGIRVKSVLDY